jgi:MFS family permease
MISMILIMAFGSISTGYSASVIGPTLGQPTFIEYFELETRSNATGILSSINSVFYAGCSIGVLFVPLFADKWGRKPAIAVCAAIILITGPLLAGTTNIGEFIVWRFFAGVGVWMMIGAVPIWITEVVPPAIRGTLVNIHGAMFLAGYVLSNWISYGVYRWGHKAAWRVPFGKSLHFPYLPGNSFETDNT